MAMHQGDPQPVNSPQWPSAGEVVISVSRQHAVVSRCELRGDGAISYRRATNAEELEAEAIRAIVRPDLPFLVGAQYPCPPELAARARWT